MPGPRPWRAALRPDDLSLAVLAEGGEFGRLTLGGRTLDEGFAWLLEQARDLGTAADRLTLEGALHPSRNMRSERERCSRRRATAR